MAELKMPSINTVMLSGRLTQDPELRYTGSGRPVVRLRIAHTRRYRDQQNDWQEDTLFIDVSAWGELAERCHDRLVKGSPVLIEGQLRQRSWEQEGQKRTTYEVRAFRVHFLEKIGVTEDSVDIAEEKSLDEEPIVDDEAPF